MCGTLGSSYIEKVNLGIVLLKDEQHVYRISSSGT